MDKKYELYFDTDHYNKRVSNDKNIEEDFIGESNNYKEVLAKFNEYCEKAEYLANKAKTCKRYNVHIIEGYTTILSKNFYSKVWLKEVGRLEVDNK